MPDSVPSTPSVELPGLPREPLSAWFAATLPELAADGAGWTGEVIAGGLSNITYRLTLPGGPVVLRRPPLAGALPSAHDMVREYTVQNALQTGPVPVPRMLALCEDAAVIGAPFYVMSAEPGRSIRTAEETEAMSVEARRAVSEQLVATLAALHGVDIAAVGLEGFGRPEGYSERLVRRWSGQWDKSRTRELPAMEELFARLRARVPAQQRSSIVHGDYRLDNTLIELADRPRLVAVLDWELSTLGDPLADLGMFLTYWDDGARLEGSAFPPTAKAFAGEGFPGTEALAQRYGELTGLDLSELGFYRALGAMKLAVILEGVHARYLTGTTVSPGYEVAGAAVPVFAERALALLT